MSIVGHLANVILYQIKLMRILQVNFIICQCSTWAIDLENIGRLSQQGWAEIKYCRKFQFQITLFDKDRTTE